MIDTVTLLIELSQNVVLLLALIFTYGLITPVLARRGPFARALAQSLDFRDTESLGLQLAVTLTDQLDGSIELDRSTGTEFRIRFPVASNE